MTPGGRKKRSDLVSNLHFINKGFRHAAGFRVQGSGFRVLQGSGFRVQGAGFFRVQGSGFFMNMHRVACLGRRISDWGVGCGSRVQEFWVEDSGDRMNQDDFVLTLQGRS